jgi:hypothetical protein
VTLDTVDNIEQRKRMKQRCTTLIPSDSQATSAWWRSDGSGVVAAVSSVKGYGVARLAQNKIFPAK